MKKTIEVVAAIIKEDNKVLATQRGYGEFKGMWEFPGGKIEKAESAEAALSREIREELEADIEVGELVDIVEYDYPEFHLTMQCFFCTVKTEEIILKEHEDAKWLTKDTLEDVEWLPADKGLVTKLKNLL